MIDAGLVQQVRRQVVSVTKPWWKGDVVSDGGLIYGLNTSGTRPPLVWCFQGNREFELLAKALGSDQPLYGMRSNHLVVERTSRNLAHLACAQAEDLASLQIEPPYFVGGNCQGGDVAQALAQYLVFMRNPVALLAVVNPLSVVPYAGRVQLFLGEQDVTNPRNAYHDPHRVWARNLPNLTFESFPWAHGGVFEEPGLSLLGRRLTAALSTAACEHHGSFPLSSYRADIWTLERIEVTAGERFQIPVEITNTSDASWRATELSDLSVGCHWRDEAGNVLRWLDARTLLDWDVAPGETTWLTLWSVAPQDAGRYMVDVDIEHAGLRWFAEPTKTLAVCAVDVRPAS